MNRNKKYSNMKTIKLLAAILLCAAMPATTNAQENLKKAIDDFVKAADKAKYNRVSNMNKNTDDNGVTTSFLRQYLYELPKDMNKAVKPLAKAFDKDAGSAYAAYTRDAYDTTGDTHMRGEELVRIAYGEKLDKSVSYGSYTNRNYKVMLVRDSQDSLRRYCYAIVWYEDTKKDKFCVAIDEIYSLDPQRNKSTGTDGFDQGKTITVAEPGVRRTITIASDGTTYAYDRSTGEIKTLNTDTKDDADVKTSFDFLKRFGTLRSTFLSPDLTAQTTMLTMIATKIAELCSNYNGLLRDEEQKFCIEALNELKKSDRANHDKYISGLFDLAISRLKSVPVQIRP